MNIYVVLPDLSLARRFSFVSKTINLVSAQIDGPFLATFSVCVRAYIQKKDRHSLKSMYVTAGMDRANRL